MEEGMTPLAWSPLAGGRIATGHGVSSRLLDVLDELATRENSSRAALAIAFVLSHPSDAVALIGSQRPEHLTDIANATRISLSRGDVYAIIQASDGAPLP
jgi:predicted oxidoreductase